MNVDDVVAARIAAARARAEAAKKRRATQQAARQAGLVARHRIKLARLEAQAARRPDPEPGVSTSEPTEGITS